MNIYRIIYKIYVLFNCNIVATHSHSGHCIKPWTIFAKHFKLFVSQGYEYVSDKIR